jgi:hypothetical protein
MRKIIAAGGAVAVLALAGCGGSSHSSGASGAGSASAGSASAAPGGAGPKAAALAARLGCKVTGTEGHQVAAHDTLQYADATGGPCSSETDIDSQGIIIITFASQAKETDWLHQNAAGQQSPSATGYDEVVSGHLWAIAAGGNGGFNTTYVLHQLGGEDTQF